MGRHDAWQIIQPTTKEWKVLHTSIAKDDFEVPTDLYYVNVRKDQ